MQNAVLHCVFLQFNHISTLHPLVAKPRITLSALKILMQVFDVCVELLPGNCSSAVLGSY